jgi:hypothetical protein
MGDADRVDVGAAEVGLSVELRLPVAVGRTAGDVHPMIVAPAEMRKPRRVSTTEPIVS